MSDVTMFTNGEGFKEYAEELSPYERDTTVVMTTVTAIRSLEIDLAAALAEVDRLLRLIDAVMEDCEEETGAPDRRDYQGGLKDQALSTLYILSGGIV